MKKIVAIDPLHPDLSVISGAVEIIRKGGIVAFPTDTFYGLAVDPFNLKSVRQLYEIKVRSLSKPLLLLIHNPSMLDPLIENSSPLAEKVMKEFWPGPLTLVFRKKRNLPKHITAEKKTIAIRLPDAAIAIEIIRKIGFPLTASSANISGRSPSILASEVEKYFGNELDLILDGGPCRPSPSTILDLSTNHPTILREGKISSETLKQFFSQLKQKSPHL